MINNINPLGQGSNVISKGDGTVVKQEKTSQGGEIPSDSFSRGHDISGDSSVGAVSVTAVSTRETAGEKSSFLLKGQKSTPDGTLYTAYEDKSNPQANYIASHGPDGELSWKAPIGADGVRGLVPGKEGFLYVATEKGVIGINSQGQEQFRVPVKGLIYSWQVDKGGNLLLRAGGEQGIQGLDSQGKSVAIPIKKKGILLHQLRENADGSAWVRNNETISRIDMTTGEKLQSIKFQNPDEKNPFKVKDFYPGDDGGLLIQATQAFAVAKPEYDLGQNPDGIAIDRPGHRPPMNLRDEIDSMYTIIHKDRVFKLDAEGKQQWMSDDLGTAPRVAFSPGKQRILCSPCNPDRNGNTTIKSIDMKGEANSFAVVKGYVRNLKNRDSDGSVFIQTDQELGHYNADGKLTGSLPLRDDLSGARLEEVQEKTDGMVVLSSADGGRAYGWSPHNNKLTCLTDH